MSEDEIVILPDEEESDLPPETPPEKPEETVEPEVTVPEMAAIEEPIKEQPYGEAWFARFGGKAPHYRLEGSASIHGVDIEDFRKCELFTTWAKPKRFGLTVEWAETMRVEGKLVRLELPFED